VGARRRASKSGSQGEGVGSGERRKGELWNEKYLRESSFLRVDKLAISATSKELNMGYQQKVLLFVDFIVLTCPELN